MCFDLIKKSLGITYNFVVLRDCRLEVLVNRASTMLCKINRAYSEVDISFHALMHDAAAVQCSVVRCSRLGTLTYYTVLIAWQQTSVIKT